MSESQINTKAIGYMTYNKLNVIMTILLVGFSISFAIVGDNTSFERIVAFLRTSWWIILIAVLVPIIIVGTNIFSSYSVL